MGQSELQISYKDWSKRVAQYAAQGIPSSVYMPIAQTDMAKTANSDAYPMSDLEANIAVAAAASGTPPIQETPRHSGGILGDIGTVVSNIEPDVAGLITSLPRGIFDIAKEAVTPSTYGKIADTVTSLNSNVGQDLRSLAAAPLLNLIPGLSDAANLTTAAGRQQMFEHPVSSALDLGGILGKLGEVAGGSLAEGAGLDAADKAAVAESPSAVASLLRGHVVQAGLRGIDRSLLTPLLSDTEGGIRAAEEGLGYGQRKVRLALSKIHHDKMNNILNKELARQSGEGAIEAHDFSKNVLDQAFGDLIHDPARMDQFGQLWQKGDIAAMDPEMRATYARVKEAIRPMLEKRVADQMITTPEGIFPKNSTVAKHYTRMQRAAARVEKQQGVVARAGDNLERARGEVEAHPPLSRFKTVKQSDVARADRVQKAQIAHDRHQAKLVQHQAEVKTYGDNYQKALKRTPPAHTSPLLAEAMRRGASEAYQGKPLGDLTPEQLAQTHLLDEVGQNLRAPQNTLYVSDLKAYLGKDEYEALLSDSLQNLLQLTREGKAPLYMHSVRTGQEMRALSTRVKSADMTESQARVKAFDITNTMTNPYLALLSEFVNITARKGTQQVIDNALKPFDKTGEEIDHIYQRAAQRKIARGHVRYTNEQDLARNLRSKEWVKWSPKTGRLIGGIDHASDHYLPKDLYINFQHFTNGGKIDGLIQNSFYRGSMKLFRTSVLYGPRHFAHVVVGGLMPVGLAHPTAFRQFTTLWPALKDMLHGRTPDENLVPKTYRRPIDYGSDEGLQHEVDRRLGRKYSSLLMQYWDSGPGRALGGISAGLQRVEDVAQTMYQSAVRLDALKRGDDPLAALEEGRRMVVNMDTASPFERTIMKQIMPFYSFTRFATLFLLQLPFDHPLRVSMLAGMSNQAQEEWGTGLPQDMMSLFFIGKPDAAGNQATVNLRNMNPFRSIANEFTLGGFFSSLNPAIEAAGAAMGINTLSGSGEMYPEISYNATTGDLQTTRPSGDMWTAIESYVPEFSAIDGYFGLSDNLRSLRSEDPQAYRRELLSMFNIPFAPSSYNIPEVRGKTALNLYKGAEQALTNAKSSGNFSGDISRYNLIPFNNGIRTELYTPAQIEAYWKQLQNEYKATRPGVDPAALMPTTG